MNWSLEESRRVPGRRHLVEGVVLADLIRCPLRHTWEIGGLDPAMFSLPLHRQVASAICALRDSGRRVHVRRVRSALRAAGLARQVTELVRYSGTTCENMTFWISELHWHAAHNQQRRSA